VGTHASVPVRATRGGGTIERDTLTVSPCSAAPVAVIAGVDPSQLLYEQASKPEFSCRFARQAGSMAFWNKRATRHDALDVDHGHRWVMLRITLQGSPIPAA
jgi:alpha-ketoglutarate-dependent taurine dioxygenase